MIIKNNCSCQFLGLNIIFKFREFILMPSGKSYLRSTGSSCAGLYLSLWSLFPSQAHVRLATGMSASGHPLDGLPWWSKHLTSLLCTPTGQPPSHCPQSPTNQCGGQTPAQACSSCGFRCEGQVISFVICDWPRIFTTQKTSRFCLALSVQDSEQGPQGPRRHS